MPPKPTKIEGVKISDLQLNPDNPRIIKDDKFNKLVENLLRYPKFLSKRPIVQKDNVIYAGNMRYKAIEHISNMKEKAYQQLVQDKLKLDIEEYDVWDSVRKNKVMPAEWVANASDFNEQEIKALTIVDNVSFGEHNWDMLANSWDELELEGWGLSLPNHAKDILPDETIDVTFKAKKPTAGDDDYSLLDVLLYKDDKKVVTALLDKIKEENGYDKLSESFMHIINYYKEHNS